ncbi:MAG TPA: HD domain-containing protein [Acidobacteriota bacterium]|nr:HD domain-containing protein [Acidobacteriota bacterium]
MDKVYVRDMVVDQAIDSPFLIRQLEKHDKKNGEAFLRLVLGDKTGEIRAVMWDGVRQALEEISQGDYAQVTGTVGLYQDQPQLRVDRIRRIEPSQVDEAEFVASTAQDIERMWKELLDAVALIRQPKLRELLDSILGEKDFAESFRRCPAAKSYHHVFRGGLLEHTLSIVKLCAAVAAHYALLDRDMLIAGAVLHDIGKVEELRYDRDFDYTDEGQLVGHIVMAASSLDRRMRELQFDNSLRAKVLHLIVSHHGEEQFGSPRKPMTPEALALHYLDMLDSRMEMARAALEQEADSEGTFTSWVRSLDRRLYKG